jgi:hypothetical protein
LTSEDGNLFHGSYTTLRNYLIVGNREIYKFSSHVRAGAQDGKADKITEQTFTS